MIVSVKLDIPEGSVYTEELSNFLGTQAALMQSGVVVNRAHARVTAQKPRLRMHPVALKVTVLPKTTIFVLQASGADPEYTQAFLQACMEEYIALKKEMRTQTSDTTVAGLTEEVMRLEKELRNAEGAGGIPEHQQRGVFQDQGNFAANYVTALYQRLAAQKSEDELLQMLTVDQNLDRQRAAGAPLPLADQLPVDQTMLARGRGGVRGQRRRPTGPTGGGGEQTDVEYFKAKQRCSSCKPSNRSWGVT